MGGVVVVPRSPGALVDLEAALAPRERDEIDDAIDELFGPDPGGSVGKTDVVLLVLGVALLVWSVVSLHSPGLAVVGGLVALLGVVLPIRAIWRKASQSRSARRRRALENRGVPMTVSDPRTRDLANAYTDLLAAADEQAAPLQAESVSAAHLALIEAAELVGETGPANASEVEYVERRVEAIRAVTAELRRHAAERETVDAALAGERSLQRAARAAAGEELDERGLSSLHDLGVLRRTLASDDDG
jgi:hypothetical protein